VAQWKEGRERKEGRNKRKRLSSSFKNLNKGGFPKQG